MWHEQCRRVWLPSFSLWQRLSSQINSENFKKPKNLRTGTVSDMDSCESSMFSHVWENWHKSSQIWKKCPCRLSAQMNVIVCTESVLLFHTVTTPIWLFFFALTSKMSLIGVCIINAIGFGFDPAPCQELLCSPICCKTAFSSTLFLF